MKNKIIVVGDIHIRYTAPSFRASSFYQELLDKLNQINSYASEYNADVYCLGDFFNSYVEDYFESIAYDLSDVTNNWYSLIGNHDCKNSKGDLRGTSFGVMVKSGLLNVAESNDKIDIFHYFNRDNFTGKSNKPIALIHDYIMPKGTDEKFEYKECSESDYNLVLCGHYHYPFDTTVGKTRYINPGSLMRLTVKEISLNRNVEVILIDLLNNNVQHLPIKYKPLTDIIVKGSDTTTNVFESKFVDMLLDSNIESNDSNSIINILKSNKVDNKIVNYIESIVKEL